MFNNAVHFVEALSCRFLSLFPKFPFASFVYYIIPPTFSGVLVLILVFASATVGFKVLLT